MDPKRAAPKYGPYSSLWRLVHKLHKNVHVSSMYLRPLCPVGAFEKATKYLESHLFESWHFSMGLGFYRF